MKKLNDFRKGTGQPDPPVILVLRRSAIRYFPGNQRIALYKNDNLNLEISIPYGVDGPSTHGIAASALNDMKEAVSAEPADPSLGAKVPVPAKTPGENAVKINGKWLPTSGVPYPEKTYGEIKDGEKTARQPKSVDEAVLHHLHHIHKTGAPVDVHFRNGSNMRVPVNSAALVMRLHTLLNPKNKRKIENIMNQSPEALKKVIDFATTNLGKSK